MPPSPPVLRAEHLSKRYGPVLANDDISFEVQAGEIHCLLGENGAGKSTLAGCLYGACRPDRGRILIDGAPVEIASPEIAIRLGIGMVHQHFVLVPSLSVVENIVVGAPGLPVLFDAAAETAKVAAACARYGLDLPLDARIWQLSVGQQQWVEILKALYPGARLLILDEPTATLTPAEADRLFTLLRAMAGEGLAVILISHKLREVMQADRVTVLRKGRVVATVATAATSPAALTALMIGRGLTPEGMTAPAAPGAPVLQVEGLRVLGDRGHVALDDLGLEIRAGEILGLAGVAGNGQSELFEALIGARPVAGGRIMLQGIDVTGWPTDLILAAGVGYIPDDRFGRGLIGPLPLWENAILGAQRALRFRLGPFTRPAAARAFAAELIAAYGIVAGSVEQPPQQLSGGNAQRLILGREFAQSTCLLLAHQPSRGLDVGAASEVHRQLRARRAAGLAILAASEELDELLGLCDRIAVLCRGELMGVFPAAGADPAAIGRLMAGRA
jgi:simple sugar transport system ATP-binding protein